MVLTLSWSAVVVWEEGDGGKKGCVGLVMLDDSKPLKINRSSEMIFFCAN